MAETLYSCPQTGCGESGMTAAQLAEHIVSHGDEPSNITLDEGSPRKKQQGRKPGRG